MARYIDANVLKEKLIQERDSIPLTCTERYSFGVETPNRYGIAMRGGINKAFRCMEQTPTADVVSKSEEGAECPTCHGTGRIGTTNWLTKNMTKKQIAEEKARAIAEHEQHIKTEAAKEIFEEIEELIYSKVFSVRADRDVTGLILDGEKFAELKKKYTEETSKK